MADDIFDQLAAAILQGEMPAGSTLPPERVLAEQLAGVTGWVDAGSAPPVPLK